MSHKKDARPKWVNKDVNVFSTNVSSFNVTCLLFKTISSHSNKSSAVYCSLFENCSGYSSLSSGENCSLFDNITSPDDTNSNKSTASTV